MEEGGHCRGRGLYIFSWSKKKGKVVPLRSIEAHMGRGGIAPTLS
jgi:hypothetical protein